MLNITYELIKQGAKPPQKNNEQDIGWDISVVCDERWDFSTEIPFFTLYPNSGHTFNTGLRLQTPPGYGAILRARSGHGIKDINIHAGVIDTSTYTGEWKIRVFNHGLRPLVIKEGDKICQAIFIKNYEFKLRSGTLKETARGDKGFGSSGR